MNFELGSWKKTGDHNPTTLIEQLRYHTKHKDKASWTRTWRLNHAEPANAYVSSQGHGHKNIQNVGLHSPVRDMSPLMFHHSLDPKKPNHIEERTRATMKRIGLSEWNNVGVVARLDNEQILFPKETTTNKIHIDWIKTKTTFQSCAVLVMDKRHFILLQTEDSKAKLEKARFSSNWSRHTFTKNQRKAKSHCGDQNYLKTPPPPPP